VPAVGLLLAVATFAQISAGFMQARKGGAGMRKSLRVIYSSLMVTVSSVFTNLAMASSATLKGAKAVIMADACSSLGVASCGCS
jgi:hypothetical protein